MPCTRNPRSRVTLPRSRFCPWTRSLEGLKKQAFPEIRSQCERRLGFALGWRVSPTDRLQRFYSLANRPPSEFLGGFLPLDDPDLLRSDLSHGIEKARAVVFPTSRYPGEPRARSGGRATFTKPRARYPHQTTSRFVRLRPANDLAPRAPPPPPANPPSRR